VEIKINTELNPAIDENKNTDPDRDRVFILRISSPTSLGVYFTTRKEAHTPSPS
jgi:hypothetical protein